MQNYYVYIAIIIGLVGAVAIAGIPPGSLGEISENSITGAMIFGPAVDGIKKIKKIHKHKKSMWKQHKMYGKAGYHSKKNNYHNSQWNKHPQYKTQEEQQPIQIIIVNN
jgi:hypothetical protein